MPPFLAQAQNELHDLTAVRFVAGALAEVSIKKMRTLKRDFEQSRTFFEEIRRLYRIVQEHAPIHVITGPAIAVALTSNHRFYGTLNRDVMRSFVDGLWQTGGEGIVVGRTGKTMLAESPYADRIPAVVFNDDMPTAGELTLLKQRLSSYGRIIFYYPEFVTIITQRVAAVDISAEAMLVVSDGHPDDTPSVATHLFEPEIGELADFFATAVRHFVLTSAFFESEVARTSARMLAMSQAEERASTAIGEQHSAIGKAFASVQSMRLLETVTVLKQWRHMNTTIR